MNCWDAVARARPLLDMSGEEEMLGPWSREHRPGWRPPALVKPGMRFETCRRRSFCVRPPGAVCPWELARAGFYYLGPGDRVQCFCCGLVLRSWEPGDRPSAEHGRFSPRCPFLLGRPVGNVLAGLGDSVDGQILRLPGAPEEEGGQAVYTDMMEERDRLDTYRDWPPYAEVAPHVLARAGFFYTGHRDNVKCFHCDGGLRNWERGDDPWREHAKWFPRCEFLVRSMGQTYVQNIQESFFNSPDVSPEHPRISVSPASMTDAPGDCHSALQSSLVQGALHMGFAEDLVLTLVQSRQLLTGTSYTSLSDLVTDLVGAEEERISQRGAEPARFPEAPIQTEGSESQHQKNTDPPISTEEELRRLKEERVCKVCLDKDVSMVFVPCGHLVVCTDCAPNLRTCPICRAVIRGNVRAFMS
ncbi:baculoviral IAP repeat-containing protein 7 isoform X1 [Pelobates fuscus]|uniref:baculoviral IAP repeat-containing protein 7 isoform X1 n=1 Tax=Pelobates fuscus TaxID=191477 RepID=UPI002FE43441